MNSHTPENEPAEEAWRDPAARYATPYDVLRDPALDDAARERILRDWQLDEQRLLESTGENMMGGRHDRLALVHEALRELGTKSTAQ